MIDILSVIVVILDLVMTSFLVWRATAKHATLSKGSRFIYLWIAFCSLYHCVIYFMTMLDPAASNQLIETLLHPFVAMFMLNPLLIAIIHWRGGNI
jgi:cytochrome c oxidase assembly factor CtaG